MSFSAPSAINTDQPTVRFETTQERLLLEPEEDDSEEGTQPHNPHDWQSLSCLTDSTEHSAPINFDMSNRVRELGAEIVRNR